MGSVNLGMIRLRGPDPEGSDGAEELLENKPSVLTFNFKSGCLCLFCCRVAVADEEGGGGGRTLEHDLDTLSEARYGRDKDLTPQSIIVLVAVFSVLHQASFVYMLTD